MRYPSLTPIVLVKESIISIDSLTANKITTTLNYTPVPNDFGSFYDTTKQTVTIAAAIPIKFNFTNFANNVALTNNTSGLPTRITVNNAGLYNIKYTLQFIKTDASNDELSVWLRRNSAAYVNTNNTYTILGTGIKNTFSNSFFVALGDNDYVEIYFSVKNINTNLSGSNTQLTPSRPATPAAMVTVQRIN
jgi:Fe-S cluster assembly iron-binding protein IscA